MSSVPDIEGVRLRSLTAHDDERGRFVEFYRGEWAMTVEIVQWNVVRSRAGTLRGVHVHRRHADYLTCVAGVCLVGLCDLRADSPTVGRSALVQLSAAGPTAVAIPPGVAHGFYFPEDTIHVYGVSEYFDPRDELGCRYDDPGLGLPWPAVPRFLSPRDAAAGSLAELLNQLAANPAVEAPHRAG